MLTESVEHSSGRSASGTNEVLSTAGSELSGQAMVSKMASHLGIRVVAFLFLADYEKYCNKWLKKSFERSDNSSS